MRRAPWLIQFFPPLWGLRIKMIPWVDSDLEVLHGRGELHYLPPPRLPLGRQPAYAAHLPYALIYLFRWPTSGPWGSPSTGTPPLQYPGWLLLPAPWHDSHCAL